MSVFTKDSGATFGVWFPERNQHEYVFEQVRIFHKSDTSRWKIIPADSNLAYSKTHHPEYGYTRFIFRELRDSMRFRVIRKKPEAASSKFNLFGLSFDNREPGIVYHSVGVNGAEIRSFLKCGLLQQHLTALEPDLIIVSLGTNDAYMRKFNSQRFKYNYRQFLDRLKVAAPTAAFLLTAPGDNYRYRRYLNRNNSKAVKIIGELAENQHMTFWNFYQVMGKLNSISRWYRAGLTARDRLHFNRKGYYLQAELLFNALMNAYGNHIEQKNKHQNQALKQ
jgi:lysophospholipase L1-like esterase